MDIISFIESLAKNQKKVKRSRPQHLTEAAVSPYTLQELENANVSLSKAEPQLRQTIGYLQDLLKDADSKFEAEIAKKYLVEIKKVHAVISGYLAVYKADRSRIKR